MAKRPRQQRILSYGEFRPTGVDDSAARRMQALAGLGETVAGVAEQFGIAKAEELAPAEALQAVEEARIVDPETGKVSYGEIAQRKGWGANVYENTVINAQYAQRKTDTTIRLNEIAVDFADDPVGYENAAKAFYDATVDAAPIEIKQDLRSAMGPRISSNFQTINANFIANSEKQSQAILQDSINTALIDLENLTANGENQLVAEELPLLYLTIDAMGEADPLYDVEGAKNKVNNALYEQRTLKNLDDIADKDGVGAAMTALEEFQDKPLPKGYSQDDLRAFTVSAQEDLNRKNSRINASAKVATKEATAKVQDYITARSLGQPIKEQERASVYEIAKRTPLEEKLFLADEIGIFATASLQARNEMLDAARTGGLDRADAYKAMLVANADINRQATKDGYSLGVSQGLIKEIEFDINDPNSYLKREQQAKVLSAHYGVPVSPLNDNEATTLALAVNEMSAQQKTDLANSFNPSSNIFAQLDEKGQGLFAMASSIGDETIMKEIFLGQDIINEGTQGKLPVNYKDIFNNLIGNSLPANASRQILDGALALEAYNKKISTQSSFEDSIQRVSGGIKKINNYKVLLPRGINQNTFQDYIDDFTPQNVESFGGIQGHTPEQAARAVSNGRIISLGSNRYAVMIGKDKDVTAMIANDNPLLEPQPFIFSYGQPELPKRPSMNDEVSTYSVEEESAKFAKDRSATGALDKLLRMNPAVPRDL